MSHTRVKPGPKPKKKQSEEFRRYKLHLPKELKDAGYKTAHF